MADATTQAKSIVDEAEARAKVRGEEASEAAAEKLAEAEIKAKARHDEAERAAATTRANAEDESKVLVEQANGLLEEATGLLEEVRERDRRQRLEASARAEAQLAEHRQLLAAAAHDREQSAEVLTRSRNVLAATERELAGRIEQVTASLATLTQLQSELDHLEEHHAQLASASTTGVQKQSQGDEPAVDSSDDDEVIDLTEPDPTSDHAAAATAAEPAEPSEDRDAEDPLEEKLRDAASRAAEHAPKKR